jgi:hypothetical protein
LSSCKPVINAGRKKLNLKLISEEKIMKKFLSFTGLFYLLWASLAISLAAAAEINVTVKNLTHGTYFTPFLVTAHGADTYLFHAGEAASDELQAMAEGGDISGLSALVGGADAESGNAYLSLVAMLLPTNDGFVGLDSLHLPTTPGTYTYYLNGYDAGTEANDELITGGGAPGAAGIPAAPGGDGGINGTGVTSTESNSVVHIHRGVLGDGDANGGDSDLDVTIHRWLNPVAKLIVEIN